MRLNREQQALLSMIRFALGHDAEEALERSTSREIDWDAVTAMAVYHGVAPLIHTAMSNNPGIPVPGRVKAALAREFVSCSAVRMFHEKALNDVVRLLNAHKLPFVILKGIALAALVYPDPESRPSGGDIDILIKNEDYPRVKRALAEIGYGLDNPRSERHELTYIGEAEFSKNFGGGKVVLDVHTDFNANSWGKVSGFDMEGFWEDLTMLEYFGALLPVLAVNAHLVFLAIHAAANHVFDRMIVFCDLDLMIRKYENGIDWPYIAAYIDARGGKKAIYFALNYCRELLGTPVPDSFLHTVKPSHASRALVPEQRLLLGRGEPSKNTHRYMHLVLLDNPRLMFKSLRFFVKRFLSERATR
ncbi:MAG: nucleotidyltransferase family protein [Deltaproteobacteria bacterium]|nr:nucleotidyltransferase family protein [Deltaproteobacteria bacterium]MBW1819219.1 nucleotidyltransferase family protein [Deltaproteobacteria bacterium]